MDWTQQQPGNRLFARPLKLAPMLTGGRLPFARSAAGHARARPCTPHPASTQVELKAVAIATQKPQADALAQVMSRLAGPAGSPAPCWALGVKWAEPVGWTERKAENGGEMLLRRRL